MKTCEVTLFPNENAAKPMRNILGMNNSPRINNHNRVALEKERFDALTLKYVRHHDAAAENPLFQLIDIHRIFPLFHLDENDPKNYFFDQTDDYLSVLADSDIEIEFRLGESIDHSGFSRLLQPIEDTDKWARICRNIIAHYKNGEMNGMHLNVTRATVWEEPDVKDLACGGLEKYCEMFCSVYRTLKADFPEIRVGGPTIAVNYDFMDGFLAYCKEQGITPDYVTHDVYTRSLKNLMGYSERCRTLLDKYGFCDTTEIITEFHLEPSNWRATSMADYDGFFTSKSAAFSASALIKLMDVDFLEVLYYYSWATSVYSVGEPYQPGFILRPVYYGLLFFQKLAAQCAQRLRVDCSEPDNVQVLGGETADGKLRLLISCYDTEDFMFTCSVGSASCKLYSVRPDYAETDAAQGEVLTANENGYITFAHSGSGVYLLEMEV